MKIIKLHFAFFITLLVLNFLIYYYYFSHGTIVLGGEGNYWLDFSIYFKNFGYTWQNNMNGQIATTMNSIFSYPALMLLIKNETIRSFIIVSSTYTLPFSVMYFLLTTISPKNRLIALLVAIFFIVNPFSVTFLSGLNPWATHTLFIYPLYFLVVYKTYEDDFKLFASYGIVSLFFAYTFTNPPHMVLITLSLPLYVFIAAKIKQSSLTRKDFIKKTFILYTALFLFHLWWIIQWMLALKSAIQSFPITVARSWLITVSGGSKDFFTQLFSFLWITSPSPDYNFLSFLSSLPYVRFLLFIPFFIIFYWLTVRKTKRENYEIIYFLLLLLAFVILLLKGVNAPFRNLLTACFNYVPFCTVFKTAPEKFGVFFVFIFSLVLFYILKSLKNSFFLIIFVLYLTVNILPFFTGAFIPDDKITKNNYSTQKFVDKPAFKKFRTDMELKFLDGRILSLPSYLNYAVMIHLYDNKYFLGVDPLLLNIPQAFIADYSSNDFIGLFQNLDSNNHAKMLAPASIRYIVLNKDQVPWIAKLTDQSIADVQNILDHKYPLLADYGDLRVYTNPYFLPHIYVPSVLIKSNLPVEKLPQITGSSSFNIKSAIYNSSENIPYFFTNKKSAKAYLANNPQVEYKKIDNTKYRIIIHNIKKPFPLVFSELYHDLWALYLKKIDPLRGSPKVVSNSYKILPGNSQDQATREEVSKFINQNFLSKLGNQFISKNFNGTIQNNNLSDGSIFEVWLPNQTITISKTNHILVNGNANAWIIDPKKLCSNNNFCIKNPDGTYTLEFIIEFWPQLVFYLTSFISVLIVLATLIILIKRYLKITK